MINIRRSLVPEVAVKLKTSLIGGYSSLDIDVEGKVAHYGIVCDLYKVIPKLTEQIGVCHSS